MGRCVYDRRGNVREQGKREREWEDKEKKVRDYEEVMKSREVGEVLGVLVHEMKTGLCVMMGNMELCAWDYPEMAKDKRVKDSALFGHYLVGVLDGLHYVSRVARGGEREREAFDLLEVVSEVVEVVGALVDDRVFEVKGEGVVLRGSRGLWREMVFGLMMNSLVHGEGDVRVECGGKEGVLEVRNGGEWEGKNGEGVSGGLAIVKMLATVEGVKVSWRGEEGEVLVWVSL